MLELKLADGYFTTQYKRSQSVVSWKSLSLPVCYEYNIASYVSGLPEIDSIYQQLVREGKLKDEIIQTLLDIYLPVHIFRGGHFKKLQLVIGFIGPRGGGKTCSASMVATLEWLLKGETVWSNVPLRIKVSYADISRVYESEPLQQLDMLDLEEGYRGGLALVDEANMVAAEAGRAMSSANIDFSYAIQQIRKRGLSVLWTTQGFMWIDNRLRWQTDFCVNCRDTFLDNRAEGVGVRSSWRVYDLSMMTGKFNPEYEFDHRWITQYECWRGTFRLKPWWGLFDTSLLFSADYIQKYKQAKAGQIKEFREATIVQQEKPYRNYVEGLIQRGCTELFASEIWKDLNIENNRAEQTKFGRELIRYFDKHRNKNTFYTLNKKKVEKLFTNNQ